MKKSSVIKRRRRLVFLVVFLILLFVILWFFFRQKDYSMHYEVSSYAIEEEYSKKDDVYSFTLRKGDNTFVTLLPNSHFLSKKLIYNVEEFSFENETCIKIYSNKLRFSPLCMQGNQQVSPHLVSSSLQEQLGFEEYQSNSSIGSFHQIQIIDTFHHDYYIWNYHGFYHISDSNQEEISLFQKDIYDPKLITRVGDYLFIPDYDANYFFDKAILIHNKTGKQEIWNLSNPIYFDSIILGTFEDSIYLVDKHEKVEWALTPKTKKQEKVGSESSKGKTYQNGWIDISITKLMNQDSSFSSLSPIVYEANSNGLFAKIGESSIQLRKNEITKIIESNGNEVFYLDKDTLYLYSSDFFEIKLMSFFEWYFNSNHVIYIF